MGNLLTYFVGRHLDTVSRDPGTWCWLLYYPVIHPLLVRVPDLEADREATWVESGTSEDAKVGRKKAQKIKASAGDAPSHASPSSPGHGDTGTAPALP